MVEIDHCAFIIDLGACPRIEVLREIAGLSQFFH